MTRVTVFENDQGEIWQCGRYYMIYLKDPGLNKKIGSWKESVSTAEYNYPDGQYRKQFRIPRHKLEHAINILTDAEEESQGTAA